MMDPNLHNSNQMPSSTSTFRTDQQTAMWAQDTYIVDSGIHSGAHTTAPSVISGRSSLHEDLLAPYTPSCHPDGEEVEQQWNGARIRAVLFPEAVDDGTAGDDLQVTQAAIPELLNLLQDNDLVVSRNAATIVSQLSKQKQYEQVVNTPSMAEALSVVSLRTRDTTTCKSVAVIFSNMTHSRLGLQMIIRQQRAIEGLVRVIGLAVEMCQEGTLFYAITALHNLLLVDDPSDQRLVRDEVRANGGVLALVHLLSNKNDKFLAIVCECLHYLALGHSESKLLILQNNGVSELLRVVCTNNYEKLLWTAGRAFKVLSANAEIKRAIIREGGLSVLTDFLHYQGGAKANAIVKDSLRTLVNLSDAATKEEDIDRLLQTLVCILQANPTVLADDPEVVLDMITSCTGILSNLTCNNEKNKLSVCRFGGIPALVGTLFKFAQFPDVTEPAVMALRHITSRHEGAEEARHAVRQCNGITAVVNLLVPGARWPLIKANLGLIRNLAQCPENCTVLRENSIPPILAQILQKTVADMVTAQHQNSAFPVYDGVACSDIAEVSLGALHCLAKHDSSCRQQVIGFQLVQDVLSVLHFKLDNVERMAIFLLDCLSEDAEGLRIIVQLNMLPILSHLGQTREDSVVSESLQRLISRIQKSVVPNFTSSNGSSSEFLQSSQQLNDDSIASFGYVNSSTPGMMQMSSQIKAELVPSPQQQSHALVSSSTDSRTQLGYQMLRLPAVMAEDYDNLYQPNVFGHIDNWDQQHNVDMMYGVCQQPPAAPPHQMPNSSDGQYFGASAQQRVAGSGATGDFANAPPSFHPQQHGSPNVSSPWFDQNCLQ